MVAGAEQPGVIRIRQFYTEADEGPVGTVHIESELFRVVIQIFHGAHSLAIHMRIASVRVSFDEIEDSGPGSLADAFFYREIYDRKVVFRAVPSATQGTLPISGKRNGHQPYGDEVFVGTSHDNSSLFPGPSVRGR